MGTHPIFESDFDCLTERNCLSNHSIRRRSTYFDTMGKTVEETYKKIDNLEHVLLRPDMYVGSVESVRQNMWIYDQDSDKLVSKEIDFIPALYKIYDEIIVNAADNKVRDKNQTMIQKKRSPVVVMVLVPNFVIFFRRNSRSKLQA